MDSKHIKVDKNQQVDKLEMLLLIPNTLCWSLQKCNCSYVLLFLFTRRSFLQVKI